MEGGTITWPGKEGWDGPWEKLRMRTEIDSLCFPSQWALFLGDSLSHFPFHKLDWAGTSLHYTSLPTPLLGRQQEHPPP